MSPATAATEGPHPQTGNYRGRRRKDCRVIPGIRGRPEPVVQSVGRVPHKIPRNKRAEGAGGRHDRGGGWGVDETWMSHVVILVPAPAHPPLAGARRYRRVTGASPPGRPGSPRRCPRTQTSGWPRQTADLMFQGGPWCVSPHTQHPGVSQSSAPQKVHRIPLRVCYGRCDNRRVHVRVWATV